MGRLDFVKGHQETLYVTGPFGSNGSRLQRELAWGILGTGTKWPIWARLGFENSVVNTSNI